jgi:SAM-dependent methyltransferase
MARQTTAGQRWDGLTDEQYARWTTVLGYLAAAVPSGAPLVLVDGADIRADLLAERLAAVLREAGRPCVRFATAACATCTASGEGWNGGRGVDTVVIADGPRWRAHVPADGWHLKIWVRTPPDPATRDTYRGDGADAIVDLSDPAWPVIRHVDRRFAMADAWHRSESRAFFAARAATWDTRFGDDASAYAAAVADAGIAAGGVVVDAGCGTGRALGALRDAVGDSGTVVGVDLTPDMLAVARTRAGACRAGLVLADAGHLPLPDACVDAVFAAGLISHVQDAGAVLRELARITRTGGRLVLFHPSGRAALAARHGRTLRPGEPLAEAPLRASTERAGWRLTRYDDPPHRFLAVADRR